MSDDTKAGSAGQGDAGSAGDSHTSHQDPSDKGQSGDSDKKRAISDMLRFKAENEQLKSELKKVEEKKLEDEKQWQKLAERYKKEAEEERKERNKLKEHIVTTTKFSEVQRIAVEQGLVPEAVEDLGKFGLDGVEIVTTSDGRYTVEGAKEFVDGLKQKKPYLFKKTAAPKINPGGTAARVGTANGGKLTSVDVANAERDYRRGKMSREEYHSIFREYSRQNPIK